MPEHERMSHASQSLDFERFGCFGKLPISREFIIEGGEELSASGLDRWMGTGAGLAKARLGPRFDASIHALPRYQFLWDSGSDRLLAGVIGPSEDAAGRKHPFTVFASLCGKKSSALSIALQVWALQEQAEALLISLSVIESPSVLREAIRTASPGPRFGGSQPEDQYQRYLHERSGADFWHDLAGRANADGRFAVLQALVETLTPLRSNALRAFRGGIRYPLSGSDATHAAMESCFWIDLTERILGRALGDTWWLRSPRGRAEMAPHFLLFLSAPSASQWISLIDPGPGSESISDLDHPYGTEPPEQRMDPNLRAVLESERSTLSDYLHWASGS